MSGDFEIGDFGNEGGTSKFFGKRFWGNYLQVGSVGFGRVQKCLGVEYETRLGRVFLMGWGKVLNVCFL